MRVTRFGVFAIFFRKFQRKMTLLNDIQPRRSNGSTLPAPIEKLRGIPPETGVLPQFSARDRETIGGGSPIYYYILHFLTENYIYIIYCGPLSINALTLLTLLTPKCTVDFFPQCDYNDFAAERRPRFCERCVAESAFVESLVQGENSGPKGRGFESRHFDTSESLDFQGFLFLSVWRNQGKQVKKLGVICKRKSPEALILLASGLGELGVKSGYQLMSGSAAGWVLRVRRVSRISAAC